MYNFCDRFDFCVYNKRVEGGCRLTVGIIVIIINNNIFNNNNNKIKNN